VKYVYSMSASPYANNECVMIGSQIEWYAPLFYVHHSGRFDCKNKTEI